MSETLLGEELPPPGRRRRVFVVGLFLVLLGFVALIFMALCLTRAGERSSLARCQRPGSRDGHPAPGRRRRHHGVRAAEGWLCVDGLISAFLVVVIALDLPTSSRDASARSNDVQSRSSTGAPSRTGPRWSAPLQASVIDGPRRSASLPIRTWPPDTTRCSLRLSATGSLVPRAWTSVACHVRLVDCPEVECGRAQGRAARGRA